MHKSQDINNSEQKKPLPTLQTLPKTLISLFAYFSNLIKLMILWIFTTHFYIILWSAIAIQGIDIQ